MRTSLFKLKRSFRDFFNERGYKTIDSKGLIPPRQSGLLFVNAGIVQVIDLISQDERELRRMVGIEGCIRITGKHTDLDMIGRSKSHHLYFEMAGHFSWGMNFNFFDCLRDALSFLIDICNIGRDRISITYHPEHEFFTENMEDLKEYTLREDGENEWSSGNFGTRGYSVEIYVDELEVWNCVYVDREIDRKGKLSYLKRPYLDSGMGIARLLSIVNGHKDTYLNEDILIVKRYIKRRFEIQSDYKARFITDYLRCIMMLLVNNVYPGLNKRQYILRKLIRSLSWEILGSDLVINGADIDCIFRYFSISGYPETTLDVSTIPRLREILISEFKANERHWYKSLLYVRNNLDSGIKERDIARLIGEKGIPIPIIKSFLSENSIDIDWEECFNLLR